jgi:hypothetical protein
MTEIGIVYCLFITLFCRILDYIIEPTSGPEHLCKSVSLDELHSLLKIDVTWFHQDSYVEFDCFYPCVVYRLER